MYSTTAQAVTREQLAACTRLIDENTCETFYRVKSAHTDEEYEVRFVPDEQGGGHFTCTCRAGQNDVPCWHIRAAKAHNALQQEKECGNMSPDERTLALASYRARDHLIKIKSKDGSLREYLPAGYRLYELSLRYEDANFATELLYFNVEHNFCIVRCRLYLGSDYEFSTKKVEACKSGPLSSLDKIETAAQARCCRLFGIGTEYALEGDSSDGGEEEAAAVTELSSPAREEGDTPAKLPNNSVVVTLKSVKAAVHKAGLAHNREEWAAWKREQLGKDTADEQLTQEQIMLLYNGTLEHRKQLKKVS